jgi:membrane associated rhomboid family serine protease
MYKILAFVVVVCFINASAFFLLPSEGFMLTKDLLAQPERVLTFQFFHVNQMHLIENIVGLLIVGFIATEISVSMRDFLLAYYSSIFIVVPLAFIIASDYPLGGNSTGIYGVLALALLRSRKLIPLKVSIPVFGLMIFPSTLANLAKYDFYSNRVLQSEFYHFAGFLAGIAASSFSIKKRNYILRELK